MANATGGTFNVILDDVHLRDLLSSQLEPPPSALGAEPTLIKMGFPSGDKVDDAERSAGGSASSNAVQNTGLSLCMCHLDTAHGGPLLECGVWKQSCVEN